MSSDSLHILLGLLESIRNSFPKLYPALLLRAFPYFHYPFYRITLCSSIYLTVAVAIERYLAVCFPHDYQSLSRRSGRAFLYVLPALTTALGLNMPRFWETEVEERYIDGDARVYEREELLFVICKSS